MKDLDRFYTRRAAAKACVDFAMPYIARLAGARPFFIEPSAGDGAFFELLPPRRRFGMDIAPAAAGIARGDYLAAANPSPARMGRTVVIGNPPFGRRGALAAAFINKALTMADTAAFIVPVIFRKYFMHKRLPAEARWVGALPLPRRSFLSAGREYAVNTEFQIWTRRGADMADMRLHSAPPIAHADFDMWQYNNTRAALKVFDNGFEFAVPCQGYQDYTRRETRASACEKHKQWMLFRPRAARSRAILREAIDYARLSQAHTTTTPGFRKGDVVREYARYV